uniref:uncharacterized protein n=1 Tax=Myxine glutinosa TaxID=7769 RepID=UPI00358F260F
MSIIWSTCKPYSTWSSDDLDQILMAGDDMYQWRSAEKQKIYLLIKELPSMVTFSGVVYQTVFMEPFFGQVFSQATSHDNSIYALTDAIISAMQQSPNALFTVASIGKHDCGYTMAISSQNNAFHFFDSHSRTSVGLSGAHGTSFMLSCHTVGELVHNIQNLAISLGLGRQDAMFELVPTLVIPCNALPSSVSCNNTTILVPDQNSQKDKRRESKRQSNARYRQQKREEVQEHAKGCKTPDEKKEKLREYNRQRRAEHRQKQRQEQDRECAAKQGQKTTEEENREWERQEQKQERVRQLGRQRVAKYREKQRQQKDKDYIQNKRQKLASQEKEPVRLDSVSGEFSLTANMRGMLDTFFSHIKEGPTFECVCCKRLLYKCAIKKFVRGMYDIEIVNQCVPADNGLNENQWMCVTCNRALKRKRMPSQCCMNQMNLIDIPNELSHLSTLEQQLICRIIFFSFVLNLFIMLSIG